MSSIAQYIRIIEAQENKLILSQLPYSKNDLSPVMSKETLDYHYGKLARGYVDRYNTGEGDPQFNKAGAFLHNLFFAQFTKVGNNKPTDVSRELITDSLKENITDEAMSLQGSGWIYVSTKGQVKTIKNHEIKNDIVLLIDMWEHAYCLEDSPDKKKYLKNIWKIIDWSVINDRINSRQS